MQRLKLAFLTLFLIFMTTALLVGCGKPTVKKQVPVVPINTEAQSLPLATNGNGKNEKVVKIEEFVFSPAALEVKTGTTVKWEHNNGVVHTVISDGLFASPELNRGDTFSYTFAKPGVYDYHCGIHPAMIGRVTVTNP